MSKARADGPGLLRSARAARNRAAALSTAQLIARFVTPGHLKSNALRRLGAAAGGLVQLEEPPPAGPGRLLLTPSQRAASAAFSVALGRIAADVLA
jgi:hypothetical protein